MEKKIIKADCTAGICPVKKTADIIGKKWTTLIIRELISENKSFSQLEKSLQEISPKVLADRLKFLKEQKIITRKVFNTNPPTTEYSLTPLGSELKKLIFVMVEFGEKL